MIINSGIDSITINCVTTTGPQCITIYLSQEYFGNALYARLGNGLHSIFYDETHDLITLVSWVPVNHMHRETKITLDEWFKVLQDRQVKIPIKCVSK